MNNPVIKIVSATKHESPNRYQNIPGKKRVLGYEWGMKGAGRRSPNKEKHKKIN